MNKLVETHIRNIVLSGDSSSVRDLLLTKSQISLINHVASLGTATTFDISNYLDVSSQNASSKLKRLYTSGYLERDAESAASGGTEYIYSVASHPINK